MITAKEALELTLTSEAHIAKCMDILDERIRESAKNGERLFRTSVLTVFHGQSLGGSLGPHEEITVTPFQQQVIDILQKNGFGAKMEIYGEGYVPRGLADDDGNGPIYKNYALTVRW